MSSTPTSVRTKDDDTIHFSADDGDAFDRTEDYGETGRA